MQLRNERIAVNNEKLISEVSFHYLKWLIIHTLFDDANSFQNRVLKQQLAEGFNKMKVVQSAMERLARENQNLRNKVSEYKQKYRTLSVRMKNNKMAMIMKGDSTKCSTHRNK